MRTRLSVILLAFACRGDGGAAHPVPGDRGPALLVEVLNASGQPGDARIGTRVLRRAGIDVVYFGNAPAALGILDSTRIIVRRGTADAGARVRKALGAGRVEVQLDSAGYSTPACSAAPTLLLPPPRASTSTRSCPHAALMSRPRLRRSTASTPCSLRRRSNASI